VGGGAGALAGRRGGALANGVVLFILKVDFKDESVFNHNKGRCRD